MLVFRTKITLFHDSKHYQKAFSKEISDLILRCTHNVALPTSIIQHPLTNSKLVDSRQSPSDFCSKSAVVYENVITKEEGQSLLKDITFKMKRRRYEKAHWDSVITGYKEVELPHPFDMQKLSSNQNSIEQNDSGNHSWTLLSADSIHIISKIRKLLQDHFFADNLNSLRWLPCHAIDLKKDGILSAHVDSIKFSGNIVAGLSLESSSIMRLKPDSHSYDSNKLKDLSLKGHIDLLLPPLSLYVLSGVSRFKYTHELLSSGASFSSHELDEVIKVEREQRYSVIFRDTNPQVK